jgi:hypothetical protein
MDTNVIDNVRNYFFEICPQNVFSSNTIATTNTGYVKTWKKSLILYYAFAPHVMGVYVTATEI